jgi:hypothetical protein
MAKATVNGLQNLRRPEDVARARGKTVSEVLPYKPVEDEALSGSDPEGLTPNAAEAEATVVEASE